MLTKRRNNSKTSFAKKLRTGKTKAIAFMTVFGLIGSIFIINSFAASSSEPPMGLMIQVSSLAPNTSPATLKTWLTKIRRDHRNKSKPGYINTVVLQDVADQNGNLLTSYLDVIRPYLPGGASPAFDRAFIGTVDLPWTGSGSKYIEGIGNAAFRDRNVSLSKTVAQAFKKRYPLVEADWYITYEANLAGFWDTNIKNSYVTYMNQLIPALSSITADKAFMWSPAFWTPYRNEPAWALPDLKTNLTDLFAKVQPPLYLNLQDFVGQSNGASTKEDADTWITYVKQIAPTLGKIQLNVEQFKQNADGSIVAGNSTEVPVRENYYVQKGTTLGPSWEIRFWHKRLYGS